MIEQLEGRPGVASDATGEPTIVVKRVLVGVDGAPSTEDAERWLGLLRTCDAEALDRELAEAVEAADTW